MHGSGNLIQTLLRHNLVDRYRLWVFPLVIGSGKRLFSEGTIPSGLKLVDSKVSTTGVVIGTYDRPARSSQERSRSTDYSEAALVRNEEPRAAARPIDCQRMLRTGSGSIVVIRSVGEQDALAEQVGFGAAVHLPFDHLKR